MSMSFDPLDREELRKDLQAIILDEVPGFAETLATEINAQPIMKLLKLGNIRITIDPDAVHVWFEDE